MSHTPTAGSSPLTRGAQMSSSLTRDNLRLIPAHAGSTSALMPRASMKAAHPRSRGEHNVKSFHITPTHGSSPLTRGALPPLVELFAAVRLIPAHAGSTIGLEITRRPLWAHPRSRGEHPCWATISRQAAGSSPLTRGAPLGARRSVRNRGLIPAHAGSTR